MFSTINYKTGNEKDLCNEFFDLAKNNVYVKYHPFDGPRPQFDENKVLAIRFTSDGGQGDIGGVSILYLNSDNVKILYGNYYYGSLDLGHVTSKLPIINNFYQARSVYPPSNGSGGVDLIDDWAHIYIGLGNHFFIRAEIFDKAENFLVEIVNNRSRFALFDAFAWLCGSAVEERK